MYIKLLLSPVHFLLHSVFFCVMPDFQLPLNTPMGQRYRTGIASWPESVLEVSFVINRG